VVEQRIQYAITNTYSGATHSSGSPFQLYFNFFVQHINAAFHNCTWHSVVSIHTHRLMLHKKLQLMTVTIIELKADEERIRHGKLSHWKLNVMTLLPYPS